MPCLALSIVLTGCATAAAMRSGQRAELNQEYDRAIVEYTRVLREDPDNRDARYALERARLRSAQEHFNRARRFDAAGRLDEALMEVQLAAELNPASGDIVDLLERVRVQLRNRVAVTRSGKTELEALVERTRFLPPLGQELPTDIKLPDTVSFRGGATARDVYTFLANAAKISIIFDPQFRDQPVTLELRNPTLQQALDSVSTTTRNFYRVTSQRTITVIPDTPAKRREYEEEVTQTFFLSNADPKETMDMLRIVMDLRRVGLTAGMNSITVRDTPERLAAAARVISAIDKARPEVVIDVELLEVDRTRFKEFGLQLASPGEVGINGSASLPATLTLRDLRNLSSSDVSLTNLPALFYRLMKNDTSTRTLANPQLRTTEGIAAQAQFGQRVPVPVTVFTPIAGGGVAQQPVTSFNYANIGVNIDITPRTHHDDTVSLQLKIEVSNISGEGFGGLPTFGNRAINTVITLRDGETNLLAGLIRDDERRVLAGIPGLSDIPVIGPLFARSRRETQETDIVLTLTPRIIRVLDLTEADLRPFRVGRDLDGGGIVELPLPPPILAPPDPAQQPRPLDPSVPTPGAPAQPGPVAPILPPAPTPPGR